MAQARIRTRKRIGREPRTPLTRERVLDAALRLADAEGLEALTMRRLGQELGVEAMTLYYHVGSKDELLNGLVDIVTGEFELAAPGTDWRTAIRATALSGYESLGRHPWAASLTLSLKRISQARLRYMNSILGVLRDAGFSDELVDRGYHAIEGHIMGFTLWEVGMNLGTRDDLEALATDFLNRLSQDDFPHVAAHVDHHLKPRTSQGPGAFEFGLELILDGLDRLRR
jgi:AcrR family transcriptional regulator